jgi:hypothetical protein
MLYPIFEECFASYMQQAHLLGGQARHLTTRMPVLSANSFYLRDICCDIATGENLHFSRSNTTPFGFQPKVGVFQEVGTDLSTFAVVSLWGKFGGLHACAATFPYIVPLPNIFLTRLFSFGPLHSSCGHLQSSPGLPHRRPSHFSLA